MSVEFNKHLAQLLEFIKTSCDLYDHGDKSEAMRIAVALRVICHQTQRSTSLLRHLGVTHLPILSTCEQIPPSAGFWPNLTNMRLAPAIGLFESVPKLDSAPTKRFVPFADWWNQEAVYLFHGHLLRRKSLVLGAANKDGGAHVDAILEPEYEKLIQGAGWSITITPENGAAQQSFPLAHCGVSALRQMGYEELNCPAVLALTN